MNRRDAVLGGATASFAIRPSAAAPLPAAEAMIAYRKILASTREEDVVCWYLGTMMLRPEGEPEIPVFQAETIMVYRADDKYESGFRVRWTEVGLFRDPVTGRPMHSWTNPLTGKTTPMNQTFRDGPGEYRIAAAGSGVAVTLIQTGATVDGVDCAMTVEGDRVKWQQVERKIRDVKPGMSKDDVAKLPRAVTTLTLWSSAAEIGDPTIASAAASGSYSFETAGLPTYFGQPDRTGSAIVRGIMRKAPAREALNANGWDIMKAAYPDFFGRDGVAPKWE